MSSLLPILLSLVPAASVAVLDVQARVGVSAELAHGITDAVVIETRRRLSGGQVLGADDIRNMMSFEKERQKLGCQDVSCLAELGGAIGATRLIAGSLGRFGDTYLLGLRLIDVRHAQVLREASARISGKNDAALLDAVASVVRQILAEGAPVPEAALAAEAPSRSHVLALTLGGVGVVGVTLAAIGLGVVLDFDSWRSAHQGSGPPVSSADAQTRSTNANRWGNLGVAGAILGVAGLTGGALTW